MFGEMNPCASLLPFETNIINNRIENKKKYNHETVSSIIFNVGWHYNPFL